MTEAIDPANRSVTILVPVHNEEQTIRPFLEELYAKCLSRLTDFEVLMMEDGSKDLTPQVLQECEKAYPNLRAVIAPKPIGYRASVTNGISMASKEWILLMDGDGQIEPEDIWQFLCCSECNDLVIGEKFPRCDGWMRIIISRLFDIATDIILGISLRDINFGFKLMRADTAKQLAPKCGRLGEIYSAELVIRFVYAGCRMQQLRVRHRNRFLGTRSTGMPKHKIIPKAVVAYRGLLRLRRELDGMSPVDSRTVKN